MAARVGDGCVASPLEPDPERLVELPLVVGVHADRHDLALNSGIKTDPSGRLVEVVGRRKKNRIRIGHVARDRLHVDEDVAPARRGELDGELEILALGCGHVVVQARDTDGRPLVVVADRHGGNGTPPDTDPPRPRENDADGLVLFVHRVVLELDVERLRPIVGIEAEGPGQRRIGRALERHRADVRGLGRRADLPAGRHPVVDPGRAARRVRERDHNLNGRPLVAGHTSDLERRQIARVPRSGRQATCRRNERERQRTRASRHCARASRARSPDPTRQRVADPDQDRPCLVHLGTLLAAGAVWCDWQLATCQCNHRGEHSPRGSADPGVLLFGSRPLEESVGVALARGAHLTALRAGGCCFPLSPVSPPRHSPGLFRSRNAWDDEAIRALSGGGAVAVGLNRCG